MSRSTPLAVAVAAAVVLLTACSSTTVTTDWDRSADFGGYRTFAWYQYDDAEHAPQLPNQIVDGRIRRAVAAELISKGLEQTSPESADLLVTYFTAVDQKVQVRDTGYYGYGYWRGWYGAGTEVYTYDEGTVVLDLIDNATDQLVWRGSLTRVVSGETPTEERVRKGAAKLLAGFPPGR